MAAKTLLEQLAQNPHLPTPPALAVQVMERASQPDCSLAALGKLISQDPALCGKILKLINSALFHLPRAVSSIDRALGLLGLRRVRSLALALSLPAAYRRVGTSEQMRGFWKASVTGAIIAREMAIKLGWPDPENELVAGLLRDLGALTLQQVFPDQYARVLASPAPQQLHRQCALEEELVGLNHAEVSAYLLRRWRLPEDMTDAIRHHHNPSRAGAASSKTAQRAGLLHFATLAAQLQLAPEDPRLLRQTLETAERQYGLTEEQLLTFLDPLTEHIRGFASLLDVDMGSCEEYSSILARSVHVLTDLAVETSLDSLRAGEEKERAEESLRQTEEQLRQAQKMEAVGQLAGGVAHDFNNLLTIIGGYSELVLAQLPNGPLRELVEEIKHASDRAALLTGQLLAFSRKQVLQPKVLDLNAVIDGMSNMLRRLIGEDIELVTDLEPALRTVLADPGQVEQVLMNLVVNARDAMPRGGRITIRTANHELDAEAVRSTPDVKLGPCALLSVRDTGCGMDEHTKARLFEPFFTTKEKGKGTGLGLATVYGIVKQAGGHLTVESCPGQGSTFTLYLPHADAAADATLVPAVPRPVTGTETILLVEDEKAVRAITRQILCMQGYTVLEARHGDEALQVSQQHAGPIHMLLTDVIMPQMSGPELAERLTPIRPEMKVLYMTGYTDDAVLRHGIQSASTALIAKPFGARDLAAKVREVLGA